MINLLPAEEKKILKIEEKWRMVLILGVLTLSFFLCLILILASIKFYIGGQAEAQKSFIETKIKESQESEISKQNIIAANKEFQKLDNFYRQPIYLSNVLEKISSTLSQGMYLNDFSYQKQSSEKDDVFNIIISGFAPNLNSLVAFRNNLESTFSTEIIDIGESVIKPDAFRFSFQLKTEKTK